MSTAASTPAPEQKPLGAFERVIKLFYAPSETFHDLNRSANWIPPFIVMVVVSLGYIGVVGKQVGWEQVTANNVRMAPASQQERVEKLPPDQKARAMQQQVVVTKVFSYAFSVINLVIMLIIALVLWGTFSFGLGQQVGYGKSLAVVVFASLAGIVKPLLAVGALMAGGDKEAFMIQNPVGTNIGFYLDFLTTPRWLYSLASSVDVVMIWVLALTAIGFTCVTKAKKGAAFGVVFGWYGFAALCGAGIAAAFS
jgi:hypothetical protein